MTPTPARLALVRACATAYTHIFDYTLANTTREERQALRRDPRIQALTAELDVLTLTGTLPQLQTCLQAVNRAYKAALARVRAQAEVPA